MTLIRSWVIGRGTSTPLQSEGNGGGFRRPDEDGQQAWVRGLLAQQENGRVRGQFDAHPDQIHLDHTLTIAADRKIAP